MRSPAKPCIITALIRWHCISPNKEDEAIRDRNGGLNYIIFIPDIYKWMQWRSSSVIWRAQQVFLSTQMANTHRLLRSKAWNTNTHKECQFRRQHIMQNAERRLNMCQTVKGVSHQYRRSLCINKILFSALCSQTSSWRCHTALLISPSQVNSLFSIWSEWYIQTGAVCWCLPSVTKKKWLLLEMQLEEWNDDLSKDKVSNRIQSR